MAADTVTGSPAIWPSATTVLPMVGGAVSVTGALTVKLCRPPAGELLALAAGEASVARM